MPVPTGSISTAAALPARSRQAFPGRSASDIPWLKLNATTRRGRRDAVGGAITIQRIDTRGGVHSGPCETAGAYFSAPYSAVYVFLQQGG